MSSPPPSPAHDSVDEVENGLMATDVPCENCHEKPHDNEEILLHNFSMAVTQLCRNCHYEDQIGRRSHPTDIDLRYTKLDIIYPNKLPLQDFKMTCGKTPSRLSTTDRLRRLFD